MIQHEPIACNKFFFLKQKLTSWSVIRGGNRTDRVSLSEKDCWVTDRILGHLASVFFFNFGSSWVRSSRIQVTLIVWKKIRSDWVWCHTDRMDFLGQISIDTTHMLFWEMLKAIFVDIIIHTATTYHWTKCVFDKLSNLSEFLCNITEGVIHN